MKYTAEQNELRRKIFEYGRKYSSNGNIAEHFFWDNFGKSKFVKKTVRDYYDRKKAKIQVTELDLVKKRLCKNVADNCLSAMLPSSGYSMGEVKIITNRLIGKVGSCDKREYYSRRCSYRPKHGCVEVEFPIRLLAKAESAGSDIIIRKKKVCHNIWICDVVIFDYETTSRGIITGDIKWHLEKAYLVEIGYTRKSYEHEESKLLGYNESSKKVVVDTLDEAKELRKSVAPDEKFYKEWFAWKEKHLVKYSDGKLFKFGKKIYASGEGIVWHTRQNDYNLWLVQTKNKEYCKVIAYYDSKEKFLFPISIQEAFEFSKKYYPKWVDEQEKKLQESLEHQIDDKIYDIIAAEYF